MQLQKSALATGLDGNAYLLHPIMNTDQSLQFCHQLEHASTQSLLKVPCWHTPQGQGANDRLRAWCRLDAMLHPCKGSFGVPGVKLRLSGHAVCACCRRTVDHTGPYVRMLLERLRSPKSLSFPPPPPTAAGALEVCSPRAAIIPVRHSGSLQHYCKTSEAMHLCWEPCATCAELATH